MASLGKSYHQVLSRAEVPFAFLSEKDRSIISYYKIAQTFSFTFPYDPKIDYTRLYPLPEDIGGFLKLDYGQANLLIAQRFWEIAKQTIGTDGVITSSSLNARHAPRPKITQHAVSSHPLTARVYYRKILEVSHPDVVAWFLKEEILKDEYPREEHLKIAAIINTLSLDDKSLRHLFLEGLLSVDKNFTQEEKARIATYESIESFVSFRERCYKPQSIKI